MSRPNASITPTNLALGPAPLPSTGAELDALLRSLLAAPSRWTSAVFDGLDRVTVRSELHGADISTLDIDLTGVAVSAGAASQATPPDSMLGTITRTEDATLRSLRLRANPLTIAGVDFTLSATAENVPFCWLEDDRSQIGIAERSHGTARVQARAETNRDALIAGVESLLAEQLAGTVTITGLEVDLVKTGPRSATIAVAARLRKGILSASAEFAATAQLDDQLVLHVSDAQLSSKNPLVAGLLLAVRDRVEAVVAQPIDLNSWTPSWLRLRDIQFELGDQIVVELTFA